MDVDGAAGSEEEEEEESEDDDGATVAAAAGGKQRAADPVAADNKRLQGEVARHKAQLEALREKDPEFYA